MNFIKTAIEIIRLLKLTFKREMAGALHTFQTPEYYNYLSIDNTIFQE